MYAPHTSRKAGSGGFSIMEILVGMAIGMVAIIVIMQSLSVWDAQKRTTTSGADAQLNGSIALYELDRDAKLAGMGFGTATAPILGCSVRAHNAARGSSDFTFNLMPVSITADTTTGRDEIAVLYGNSKLLTADIAFTTSTATKKVATRQGGFLPGDKVVVTRESGTMACDLVEISASNDIDAKTLVHENGNWNRSAGTESDYSAGLLFNLGDTPRRHVWRIQNNNLVWFDDLSTNPTTLPGSATAVAEGIVGLKAVYGIATTGTTIDNWTATAPLDWTTVRAIRVGVLARSRQLETVLKDDKSCCVDVTPDIPTWFGSTLATPVPFVMTNLDGSAGNTVPTAPADNWKRYRYRVYESLIPLRNIIWGVAS